MNSTEAYLEKFNSRLWSLLRYHQGEYRTDFEFPLIKKHIDKDLKHLHYQKKKL
jgi:hypothetical protein